MEAATHFTAWVAVFILSFDKDCKTLSGLAPQAMLDIRENGTSFPNMPQNVPNWRMGVTWRDYVICVIEQEEEGLDAWEKSFVQMEIFIVQIWS